MIYKNTLMFKFFFGDAWVAQSVKRLTLDLVVISESVSLSPVSGSGLTAPSLEPVSDLCLSLSLILPRSHSVSVSLSKINKH